MRTGRAAWLILAADGPATEVPDRVPSTVVRVIADPRRFRDVLLAERPRIVVCAQPPADAEALRSWPRSDAGGAACEPSTSRRPMPSRSDSPRSRPASTMPSRRPRLGRAGGPPRLARDEGPGPAGSPIVLPIGDGARDRPRGARAAARRPGRPPAAQGVRPARAPRRAPGPRLHATRPPRTWSGARPRTAARGRWTSTSAGCARRSRPLPDHPTCLVTVRGVGYRLDDRASLRPSDHR